MKRILFVIALLAVSIVFAETRSLVPRGSGEGSIGTAVKPWGTGIFNRVETAEMYLDGALQPKLPFGTPGEFQIMQWNGTEWYAGALYGPPPVTGVGTNEVFWTNVVVGGISHTWVMPGSNMWIELTGAGGASPFYTGAAGGFTAGLLTVPMGSLMETIVGTPGLTGTNAPGFPGGGQGAASSAASRSHGGGLTGIRFAGSTNWLMIAPGGAGGLPNLGVVLNPGQGGGIIGANGSANSNAAVAYGARATDVYGRGAYNGTNSAGITACEGTAFQGGSGSNVAGSTSYNLTGGGAGNPGGSAPSSIQSNATQAVGTGAGGVGWVDTNYVTFAYTIRPASHTNAPMTDLPWYVPGRGGPAQPGFGRGLY